MAQKTCLVMGGEAKDACAMGVLIINILEVCPNLFDEIVIYHNGISNSDQKIMSSLFQIKFVDYSFHIPIISKVLNSSIRGFSEMVFYKYELFKLIQEYDRVVVTDYDVIYQNNINNTFSMFNNGIWLCDGGPISEKFWKRLVKLNSKSLDKYNLSLEGISAPLMVFNQNCISRSQADNIYKYLQKMTIKLSNCIKCPEESILSLAIQKFNIRYQTIDPEEFVHNCKTANNPNASIQHCIGRPKFWDGYYNETWNKRYNKWLELGGSKYHEPLQRRLIRYTYSFSVRKIIKSCFRS